MAVLARTSSNLPDRPSFTPVQQKQIGVFFVSGDRKYKVPVLDPLEILELKIAEGGPRQAGLTLKMTNAKVYGMKDSKLEVTE
jgi:hypothetical protein